MSFCSLNANYDDTGFQCDDVYSTVSGLDTCDNMSVYQRGLTGNSPSVCNQVSNYTTVAGMYKATQVPAIAGLQYFPQTATIDAGRVYNRTLVDTQGNVVAPVQVKRPMPEQVFMKQVKRM